MHKASNQPNNKKHNMNKPTATIMINEKQARQVLRLIEQGYCYMANGIEEGSKLLVNKEAAEGERLASVSLNGKVTLY